MSAQPTSGWAGFVGTLLATMLSLTTGLLALAFLVDPYDTGRTPLALKPGLRPQGPRTAAASRARDPVFQGAIIGNSHIQLISPDELKARTGLPFVSLAIPGTGPKEALALIDGFLRHRDGRSATIVLGIDQYWCTPDPALTPQRPFPFWLFSRDRRDYLAGLISFDVLRETALRLAYLFDARAERARPDGYWDYEANFDTRSEAAVTARRAQLATPIAIGGDNASGPFPAADALEAKLAGSPDIALVMVRPPSYATARPVPGSPDALADAACRDRFAELARRRPRSAFIDWRSDRPENRDPERFFDHTHYDSGLARKVEAEIAAEIARLR